VKLDVFTLQHHIGLFPPSPAKFVFRASEVAEGGNRDPESWGVLGVKEEGWGGVGRQESGWSQLQSNRWAEHVHIFDAVMNT